MGGGVMSDKTRVEITNWAFPFIATAWVVVAGITLIDIVHILQEISASLSSIATTLSLGAL